MTNRPCDRRTGPVSSDFYFPEVYHRDVALYGPPIRKGGIGVKMEPNQSRWGALATLAVLAVAPAASAQPQVQPQSALVKQYCVGCHNQKLSTAGVSLEGLAFSKVGDHASVWERVLRKVRSGQMPPTGLPHPDATATASFTKWLENSLN